MMKLETHCHSLGGSSCATAANERLIADYTRADYGGVVITNHISKSSYEFLQGETHAKKIRYYYSLIEMLTEQFKPFNVKVFFGAEIRAAAENGGAHGEEFTVYGITEKDMFDNKPLYEFSQEELFRFAEKRGLFMYQTHPFREGVKCGNPRFMHGAEMFNGHFHHYNYNALAERFCADNNLIGLSGTDYHHDFQPITAGIYVPKRICTNEQLISYIFNNSFEKISDAYLYERELKKYKENK